MVHAINLLQLRNAEFVQFFKLLKASIADAFEGGPVPAPFAAKLAALDTKWNDLQALFKNDPASALSASLLSLDADRDGYIGGLSLVCRGHLTHPDSEVRAAAGLLVHNLKLYGPTIGKQGLVEETASINNILKDWKEKPELAGAAAALNLNAWLVALADVNKKFEEQYIQRNQEDRSDLPFTMKEKRGETRVAYDELMEKLAGYYTITEGDAPWKAMLSDVNALVDRYNDVLAARVGRVAAGKEEAKP